jgi:hypothetical protein
MSKKLKLLKIVQKKKLFIFVYSFILFFYNHYTIYKMLVIKNSKKQIIYFCILFLLLFSFIYIIIYVMYFKNDNIPYVFILFVNLYVFESHNELN